MADPIVCLGRTRVRPKTVAPHPPDIRALQRGISAVPDCRRCGACCSFSKWWPALALGNMAERTRIPDAVLRHDGAHMLCFGDRCSALSGVVGTRVECAVYEVRPDSCRAFRPGGPACLMVREKLGVGRFGPRWPRLTGAT